MGLLLDLLLVIYKGKGLYLHVIGVESLENGNSQIYMNLKGGKAKAGRVIAHSELMLNRLKIYGMVGLSVGGTITTLLQRLLLIQYTVQKL
ncbi:hypothetical protein GcM3_202039 [Golovinomyces cichoracearum]|uniref:Uncharacterized protein n=1 Tax=Golovinomyces cichoracearum TaxID=62708 RepID=A0A420HD58_9PEZI|nr:hypothetical protein GcM3_202039 [Golovinomyces cichoracearum]